MEGRPKCGRQGNVVSPIVSADEAAVACDDREMTAGRPSPDDAADALARRIRAAIAAVKGEIRGLPPDQAEARLSAALGADHRVLGPQDLRRLVRHIQDPWWGVKHPLRSWREIRGK